MKWSCKRWFDICVTICIVWLKHWKTECRTSSTVTINYFTCAYIDHTCWLLFQIGIATFLMSFMSYSNYALWVLFSSKFLFYSPYFFWFLLFPRSNFTQATFIFILFEFGVFHSADILSNYYSLMCVSQSADSSQCHECQSDRQSSRSIRPSARLIYYFICDLTISINSPYLYLAFSLNSI